jgi:hypothetical protein
MFTIRGPEGKTHKVFHYIEERKKKKGSHVLNQDTSLNLVPSSYDLGAFQTKVSFHAQ